MCPRFRSSSLVPTGFIVDHLDIGADRIGLVVRSEAAVTACPNCGTPSRRIQSRYRRRATDLPLGGRRVELPVVVRRFRCDAAACERTIFAERFPGPPELARRLSALARRPVGRRQPQCRRTLANGEGAGLPRIAPRGWGMGDAPPARGAGQHRAASACAVGANLGTAANDGSRPVDQGGDADRGRGRGRGAGAGRGTRGSQRLPDDGARKRTRPARRMAQAGRGESRRLLRPGIGQDRSAVQAAITLPWSNGQTEGQVTKLKLVKRQMYGRGKIDLLQARLIGLTP